MIYTIGERRADLAPGSYVAPSAQLIGSVRLAADASVWFNVVIRGDTDWIEIGEGSNIQDGTVIHTDPGVPVRIGANVTVGHAAFLHGCSVGDGSMIANGAMVLDGAVIGRRCLIAAGALVPNTAHVRFEIIKPHERPVSVSADFTEIRDIVTVDIKESRDISHTLLFDPENHLEERIAQEQFAP